MPSAMTRARLHPLAIIVITISQVLIFFVRDATTFNFEVINPLVRRGDPGTYFGYSVAQHRTVAKGDVSNNW